jgi:hypothetical protein
MFNHMCNWVLKAINRSERIPQSLQTARAAARIELHYVFSFDITESPVDTEAKKPVGLSEKRDWHCLSVRI